MPVSELLARMSSAELTEWIALFKIENDEQKRANDMARNRSRGRR